MAAPRPPTAMLQATPDDVEAQFYDALREGDIDKLMALWSDDDDIVCVHPGGARDVGAQAIRASFEAIFKRGGIPVQAGSVRRTRSIDAAVHNLVETVLVLGRQGAQQGYAVATNVYIKTAQGWRIVAHHASPGSGRDRDEPDEAPSTLH
ncbi:MAG: nuclear transport factor 2 family protein [Ideonella sp.]|nr:nuclear transport factor 2 family protein [Ideonella sp.]MCC7456720.1 nuclear transport factor 2 family protein [Nitrospira sp.]